MYVYIEDKKILNLPETEIIYGVYLQESKIDIFS